MNRDEFIDGYVTAALWADCEPHESHADYGSECGGREGLDARPGAVERMVSEGMLDDFLSHHADDLDAYSEQMGGANYTGAELAGHDFWLTRNGHGAGFWDRGLGALGDRLAEAARQYGTADDHTPFDCGDGTWGA